MPFWLIKVIGIIGVLYLIVFALMLIFPDFLWIFRSKVGFGVLMGSFILFALLAFGGLLVTPEFYGVNRDRP